MSTSRNVVAVFSGFAGVLMILTGFMLLPGCPCPGRCAQEDKATELVRYTVHGIDLDQPFADSTLDSWLWDIIALENALDSADRSGAQLLDRSAVPAPPLEEAYTLTGYWLIADGQISAQYVPAKIADGARAYRLYEQTTAAEGSRASAALAVWDYVLDEPGANDDSAILQRDVIYNVAGTTTIGPRTVSPSARMRVAASDLWETVATASEDLSGATLLADNDVPAPLDASMRCSVCAYTLVVNFVVEDYWGDLFAPGCGDCGVRIESNSVVIDGVLVYDIIRAWDYRY